MGSAERRGNGHQRENKIEKLALDLGRDVHWGREHPHISYGEGRCGYLYDDDARCVWRGRLLDGMCAEHRWLTRQAEQIEARRARQRKAREVPAADRDHSTPWHCGLSGCRRCAGKPSYRAYLRGVGLVADAQA